MDVHAAHHAYRESLQDESQTNEEPQEEEVLFIKSYAVSPSLDEVLWKKLETPATFKSRRLSAKSHGMIDYAFAAALGIAPLVFGLKNKVLFGLLGDATALSAALTKDSKGVLPVMPLKTHRAVDVALLAGLAGIATTKAVRSHKPSLIFSLGMLAAGVTTILLTDWKTKQAGK